MPKRIISNKIKKNKGCDKVRALVNDELCENEFSLNLSKMLNEHSTDPYLKKHYETFIQY